VWTQQRANIMLHHVQNGIGQQMCAHQRLVCSSCVIVASKSVTPLIAHSHAAPCMPPHAGRCLHTVQHHTDYVTSLAASEASGKLFSAGLHSEVIMYDMQVRG
jgi:hypothetical protein